jgi:hypothetical protein
MVARELLRRYAIFLGLMFESLFQLLYLSSVLDIQVLIDFLAFHTSVEIN